MTLGLVFFTFLAAWTGNVYSTHGPVQGCCLRVSDTKVRLNTIADYRNQPTTICGIAAVVFTTKSLGRICANPNSPWTLRAKAKVDADRLNVQQAKEDMAGGANEASTESPKTTKGRSLLRRSQLKGRRNIRNRRLCVVPKEPSVEA